MTSFDPNEKKKLDKFWNNLNDPNKKKESINLWGYLGSENEKKKLDRFWDNLRLNELGYGDKTKKISTNDPNEKKKLNEFGDNLGYSDDTKIIPKDECRIIPSEEIIQTAFSLEKYLEEFIIDNWNSIFPNYDLNEKEVHGRRKKIRIDNGEIDIFAVSKDKKEFLIIELKKGRAGDSVIGQIQRYMASVEESFAKNNEKVSGVIIAYEDDPKIRKTLRRIPNVHFYQYKIHFELKKLKI